MIGKKGEALSFGVGMNTKCAASKCERDGGSDIND